MRRRHPKINFERVARAALPYTESICSRWLPGGRKVGREYVVRNPKRLDVREGSFKVNIDTGRWSDFATNDRGGDIISLAAFLFSMNQKQAAMHVADMMGVDPFE